MTRAAVGSPVHMSLRAASSAPVITSLRWDFWVRLPLNQLSESVRAASLGALK